LVGGADGFTGALPTAARAFVDVADFLLLILPPFSASRLDSTHSDSLAISVAALDWATTRHSSAPTIPDPDCPPDSRF
jgi:hypothetical protein